MGVGWSQCPAQLGSEGGSDPNVGEGVGGSGSSPSLNHLLPP